MISYRELLGLDLLSLSGAALRLGAFACQGQAKPYESFAIFPASQTNFCHIPSSTPISISQQVSHA